MESKKTFIVSGRKEPGYLSRIASQEPGERKSFDIPKYESLPDVLDEVFIPVNNWAEAMVVERCNDVEARAVKRTREKTIKGGGVVQEQHMPDVQVGLRKKYGLWREVARKSELDEYTTMTAYVTNLPLDPASLMHEFGGDGVLRLSRDAAWLDGEF